MRTLLNEIKLIDDHLLGKGSHEDALLFDAMLILDNSLAEKVMWQKQTIVAVNHYGRKKLKGEIEAVHRQLFTDDKHRTFRQMIMAFFKG